MKRAAPIVFFLISFLLICPSLSEASLKLYVENEEVQLKHDLVMINGNYMIPLWVFAEHLGAEIEIDGDRIQVDFDDQSIGMQLGVDTAQVNGSEFKLEVAPQRLQGRLLCRSALWRISASLACPLFRSLVVFASPARHPALPAWAHCWLEKSQARYLRIRTNRQLSPGKIRVRP